MKNLKFNTNEILGNVELKTILGGSTLTDGFDCGPIAYACDAAYPDSYLKFAQCMHWKGCLEY